MAGPFRLSSGLLRHEDQHMPNWWQPWAERIARILAEQWGRSAGSGASEPESRPEPAAPSTPPAPAPDDGADLHSG